MKSFIFLVSLFLVGVPAFAQIQCTVDVQIVEGTSIEMCENAPSTISGSAGFVSYGWTGPETVAGQVITPNFSGQYVLAAVDAIGCISTDTILVTINPTPVDAIVSSEGNPLCPGSTGSTLSLSNSYVAYDWGGGNNSPTLFVTSGGTYNVTFVDGKGCAGQASLNLDQLVFSVTTASTSACSSGGVDITASGGTSYLWSTGETTSTINVNPSGSTVYSVTITNGTCTQTLLQTIEPVVVEAFEFPDTVYLAPGQGYFVSGPPGFSTYSWTPTNQINNTNTQGVTFVGDSTQLLTLTAVHPDGCVWEGSVLMIVVRLTIPNGISPNGDYRNDTFRIPELDDYPGALQVFNRWGDVVYKNDNYRNTWGGTCETDLCLGNSLLPEGTYFYLLDVEGVTFKGYITLKL